MKESNNEVYKLVNRLIDFDWEITFELAYQYILIAGHDYKMICKVLGRLSAWAIHQIHQIHEIH